MIDSTKENIYCDGNTKDEKEKGSFPSPSHPKVYLCFGAMNKVICPYCSRVFLKTRKEELE